MQTHSSFSLSIHTNLAEFSSCAGALAACGREIIIEVHQSEPGDSVLVLRSLNDSQSSFCAMSFNRDFFDSVSFTSDDKRPFFGKIIGGALAPLLRQALSRSPNRRLSITHKPDGAGGCAPTLLFELAGELCVRRRWEISFEGVEEVLHATFDPVQCDAACVRAAPVTWEQLLLHIHRSEHELAVVVTRNPGGARVAAAAAAAVVAKLCLVP